jgi:hypothetical protein
MPTRLCLNNTGKPSSNSITNATMKKIGEKRKSSMKAKSLLSICLNYYTAKLMKIYDAMNYIIIIFLVYASNRTFGAGKRNIGII